MIEWRGKKWFEKKKEDSMQSAVDQRQLEREREARECAELTETLEHELDLTMQRLKKIVNDK